ncbi:MAG: class I SAM-dependent methyltransferase [Nitrosopumilus sp.]|nr:class I SAM-dependent methyltransferase [Nitrosopumilus sp.]
MSYIPGEYWAERGKEYKENFRYSDKFELQEQMLIECLKKYSFSSILEVGCGFGRITKLLLSNFHQITDYFAFDLSPHQIENAKINITGVPKSESVQFAVSDIQSFQSPKKYDLVLASEVLLHILPSEIEQIIGKLVSFSDKYLCNIDWYEEKTPRNAAPHNFIHQYEKIYKSLPTIESVHRIPIVKKKGFLSKIDTKQSIFFSKLRT